MPRLLAAEGTAPKTAAGGKWRAAIIGHTKEGDYGHALDLIFNDIPGVEIVAVADPDPAGRAKAAARCKAPQTYADWRELLSSEKPQLVCLAARWTHERHPAARAVLESGAHLFSEKPFTRTLADADDLVAIAERTGAKIAVAHQMRLAPSVQALQRALSAGLIGELLEIHAWGKQDDRAGGEDLIVLGTHLFDLMRFFAGDSLWCSARVLSAGHEITQRDARMVKEQIGPVAGDEVFAEFAFPNGVVGTFTSRKRLREQAGPWGLELVGTKTRVRLLVEVYPAIYVLRPGKWENSGRVDQWERLETDPGANLTPAELGFGPANRRVVDDWLDAISQNREPACSGQNAMKSLEMIMSVYTAALTGKRAALPLSSRAHPLEG